MRNPPPPSESTPAEAALSGLSLVEKRLLLIQMLQREVESQRVFPLSHGQRGQWFLYQFDRTSAAYNMFFPIRIRGPFDTPAFRQALQTVVDRHGSLRTTYGEHNGELLQRVHDPAPIELHLVDASGWTPDQLRDRLHHDAHCPFDLERGPLVRSSLFHLAPEDHVFLITVHHIAGDFLTMGTVIEEMSRLYPVPRELPPLPTATYADFVRWQAEMLAGPQGQRLESFWKRQLADSPWVLELPTDYPRPPIFSHSGAALPCRLGTDLTRRLRAVGAAEGVTLYTVLLAAFQTLLWRYTAREQFLVGSPFAGRSRAEFQGISGYFINMLPLRADLSGDPTFHRLLRRTGAVVLDALQHQDYPFGLMVERLKVKRDPSRPPLVQVTFTLDRALTRQNATPGQRDLLAQPGAWMSGGGVTAKRYPLESHSCQGDLEMVLEEGDLGVEGVLRYNTTLFAQATAQRMLGHFLGLLTAAVEDPDAQVSELPWVSDEEQQELLRWGDNPPCANPGALCLHQLVERHVALTPHAVALRHNNDSLTYAQLDSRAAALAAYLRHLGAARDTLIALCLERSPDLIIAMLAVLKSGAAFVPLDPASPISRLRDILTDIASPVLLTQRPLVECLRPALPEVAPPQLLCLDDPLPDLTVDDATPGLPQLDDLAYLIYTSGSTGKPRGVMIEHRAICNTILWRLRDLDTRPDDRFLLSLPCIFDAALGVIFQTLAGGSTLVLADPAEDRDPWRLLDRVTREQITVLYSPPHQLRLLLEGPFASACRSVRMVGFGGEPLPPQRAATLLTLFPGTLFNMYGPTEAAIDSTWYVCPRGAPLPDPLPIGRPVAGARVYVLDAEQRLLPVGVPGELYVGGAGLARGYFKDPQQTAARFLPDLFGEPGDRLYRTGDRCRWLPDGNLDFLGRIDDQVKLRGYRIELGEIEAALARYPGVSAAAVLVRPVRGESALVAYVAARTDNSLDSTVLRHHLRSYLPDYMIPAHYVVLSELPLTQTRKIDRRSLPDPIEELTPQRGTLPRTPLEAFLAALWCDILQVQQVGIHDNFFELGGNSFQATLLIHRLQESLGRPIYTVAVFEAPTVSDLARYLATAFSDWNRDRFGYDSVCATSDSRTTPLSAPLVVPLQPDGDQPPCFVVHPPGGIVVCYQALAVHLGRTQPLYGVRSSGLYGDEPLPTTMQQMAAEYLVAIRHIQPTGPYRLVGWSVGGLVAFEIAQQLTGSGEYVSFLGLLDTALPQSPEETGREYGLDQTLADLSRMGPDELLPYLWDHAVKLGLIDASAPIAPVQQILNDLKRLFHHHLCLAEAYQVRPYSGPITLFRPADAPVLVVQSDDRGWGAFASQVEVRVVPGQHHSMVREPHVQHLASQLRDLLQRTR